MCNKILAIKKKTAFCFVQLSKSLQTSKTNCKKEIMVTMIQREQKQWRTEHPHVSVQTVYTDGHVPFGQLILINYLNSAFYTREKKKEKKNSYWNKHAKQPLTRRWNNRTIIYLLKTALDIHGKAKFSLKKKNLPFCCHSHRETSWNWLGVWV